MSPLRKFLNFNRLELGMCNSYVDRRFAPDRSIRPTVFANLTIYPGIFPRADRCRHGNEIAH